VHLLVSSQTFMGNKQISSTASYIPFPNEIILQIFSFLLLPDLLVCARVSKKFRALTKDPSLKWYAVFVWGGQTSKDRELVGIPQLMNFNGDQIVEVAAGLEHFIARTSHGHVLGWGNNYYKQLGSSISKVFVASPTRLDFDKKIKRIFAGGFFSAAITESNEIFICGSNNHGQLGVGHLQTDIFVPQNIPFFFG